MLLELHFFFAKKRNQKERKEGNKTLFKFVDCFRIVIINNQVILVIKRMSTYMLKLLYF
jgi:hypothetical protein